MKDTITVSSSKKQEMIDITNKVNAVITKSNVKEGICNVYVMHATASIVINENADPNICLDTIDSLNKLVKEGVWRHDKIDNNAASHIKATILGPSETVPISNGKLQLGTWQGLMLFELDGPRSNRKVVVSVLGVTLSV